MSTCKQWGYPSPVLASAPLSGNETKQITGRVFSSCCHFVVFPTLFFCLLCCCTLTQKWNYANTRKGVQPKCTECTQHGLAHSPHTWWAWWVMAMSQRWCSSGFECTALEPEICARASNQRLLCFVTEYFSGFCVYIGKGKILLDHSLSWRTTCSGRN